MQAIRALGARAAQGRRWQPHLLQMAKPGNSALSRYHHNQVTSTQVGGPVGTPAHRVYFAHDGVPISPWHDIPLFADPSAREYNMVVEIPRWTNAKLEIDTSAPFNPIKQDEKKGALRYVANVFPYKGYIWNYGALPQTFEDPSHRDPDTGCVGDGDPVDVVEIGQAVCEEGSVHRVKVLGVVALIDGGETDWKVVAIRSDDPLARKMSDIGDVERLMPGLVQATVDWFTKYKVPDGKPLNPWAFDGKPRNAAYAHDVIASTHGAWKKLVDSPSNGKFSLTNLTVASSAHALAPSDASSAFRKLAAATGAAATAPRDQGSDHGQTSRDGSSPKWHFVCGEAIVNQ